MESIVNKSLTCVSQELCNRALAVTQDLGSSGFLVEHMAVIAMSAGVGLIAANLPAEQIVDENIRLFFTRHRNNIAVGLTAIGSSIVGFSVKAICSQVSLEFENSKHHYPKR